MLSIPQLDRFKMKNVLLTLFFSASAILLFSKSGLTQTHNKGITINIGLSDEGYGYPNNLSDYSSNICPTINLYSEYFFDKLFSVGIYGAFTYSYSKYENDVNPEVNEKNVWKGWDFGLRYTLHFSPVLSMKKNTDLYLSAFFGYTTRKAVYDQKNIYRDILNYNTDALSVGGILGFRYFLSEKVGLYAEAGLSRQLFFGGGVTYDLFSKEN